MRRSEHRPRVHRECLLTHPSARVCVCVVSEGGTRRWHVSSHEVPLPSVVRGDMPHYPILRCNPQRHHCPTDTTSRAGQTCEQEHTAQLQTDRLADSYGPLTLTVFWHSLFCHLHLACCGDDPVCLAFCLGLASGHTPLPHLCHLQQGHPCLQAHPASAQTATHAYGDSRPALALPDGHLPVSEGQHTHSTLPNHMISPTPAPHPQGLSSEPSAIN